MSIGVCHGYIVLNSPNSPNRNQNLRFERDDIQVSKRYKSTVHGFEADDGKWKARMAGPATVLSSETTVPLVDTMAYTVP